MMVLGSMAEESEAPAEGKVVAVDCGVSGSGRFGHGDGGRGFLVNNEGMMEGWQRDSGFIEKGGDSQRNGHGQKLIRGSLHE
ncbi:hypothetical protein RYX36_013988 [Vicia faba]